MSKTALVTGSSRGIGKACALKLAELGYDIAVNCNSNLEMAQKAVDEITALGRKAVAYKANTADIDEVIKISDRIIVMFEGKIMGEISGSTPDMDKISAMMGGKEYESINN